MTSQSQEDKNNTIKEVNNKVDADNKVADAEIIETVEPSWSDRLLSADHWLRFAFMVLFVLILIVVSYLVIVLIALQFFWVLITTEGNDKLKAFGSSTSSYIHQALRFLTYNSNDKPFPFADWPEPEHADVDKEED